MSRAPPPQLNCDLSAAVYPFLLLYPSRDSVSSEPQRCSSHSQPNAQAATCTTL